SEDQEPPPLARVAPAVGLPLASTAVTKRSPPVARAANSSAAAELNGLGVESSANRKVPAWAAWTTAPVPAAKLSTPAAGLLKPPATVAPPPLAVLSAPPPTTPKLAVTEFAAPDAPPPAVGALPTPNPTWVPPE